MRLRAALLLVLLAASCAGPQKPEDRRYALVVSFTSPGDGPNDEAAAELDTLVKDYEPSPSRQSFQWGMEGEHLECFTLHDLHAEQRADFIDRVRRKIGSLPNVAVREDARCFGRRR